MMNVVQIAQISKLVELMVEAEINRTQKFIDGLKAVAKSALI